MPVRLATVTLPLEGRAPARSLHRPPLLFRLSLAVAVAALSSCDARSSAPADPPPAAGAAAPTASDRPVPTYGYEIVNTFPHDRGAFTQGLVYLKGILIESTGLNGRSSLRKVDLADGHVREELKLSGEYFAEGMTVLGAKIYQLTWQKHVGFVYDLQTLERQQTFSYAGEGWGLTTDGTSLIMSDGSHELRFLDPTTFKVTRTLQVFDHSGAPLKQLNELEYVRGEIFANIWQTPYVARIDPANGRLLGVIDFTGLLPREDHRTDTDVLNGIAYDATHDRLFVTGKNWPKLFEVRLKAR
jgi:glutamine cyclotransferase